MTTRIEIDCENGITLATLKADDAETMAQLINNRAIGLNVRDSLPHPYSLTDAVYFIEAAQKSAMGLVFGMYLNGKLTGVISVIPQTDIHQLSGEIGYWLGEPYWSQGITTVAIRYLVRYVFATTRLIRIYAGIMTHNKPSMRVLEKNGFTLDFIQRAAVFKDGKIVDEYRYSLIDEAKLAALPS